MLALSAYFALHDAVGACGAGDKPVPLVAPATPERLLMACEAMKKL
jgi:xanthine dehydrogenase large subunit